MLTTNVAAYLVRSLLVYVWCTVRNQTESDSEQCTTSKDLIKYADTLPNYPHRCILIDYFNKSNFSKIQ